MNEYLESELQEEIQQEGFVIDDLGKLNWAFRKIAAYKAKEQEVKDLAKAEYDRIKEWEDKELKKLDNNLSFLEHKVFEYHMKRLEEDPKAKTITTPYGKAKSLTRKPAPKISDKLVLIDYISENLSEDYIKVTHDVDWASVKKELEVVETENGFTVIDENGMVVPGVEVEPGETKFKVEV